MDLYVMQNGEQIGPLSEEALTALARSGAIYLDSPCWKPGMEHWCPMNEVLNLEEASPVALAPVPLPAQSFSRPKTQDDGLTFHLRTASGDDIGRLTLQEIGWKIKLGEFDGSEWIECDGQWRQLWEIGGTWPTQRQASSRPRPQRRRQTPMENSITFFFVAETIMDIIRFFGD